MALMFWNGPLHGTTKQMALCDEIVPANELATVFQDVTCQVCRDNFLNAKPLGDGSRVTFREAMAIEAVRADREAKERAKLLTGSQWSTEAPKPPTDETGWTTAPSKGSTAPIVGAGAWRTE